MVQRSVSHNSALLSQEPPNYLIHPDAPFVEGKEDSEIDFTVSAGGFHILPLSIKVSVAASLYCAEGKATHLGDFHLRERHQLPIAVQGREDERNGYSPGAAHLQHDGSRSVDSRGVIDA